MAVRPPIPRPVDPGRPLPPGGPGPRPVPAPVYPEEVQALIRGAVSAFNRTNATMLRGMDQTGGLVIYAVGQALGAVPLVGGWLRRNMGPRAQRAVRRVSVPAGAAPTAAEARTIFAQAKAMEFFAGEVRTFANVATQAYGHLAWTLLYRPGTGTIHTLRDRLETLRDDVGFPSRGEPNAHARLDLQRGRLDSVENVQAHLVHNVGVQTGRINEIATRWVPELDARLTAHGQRLGTIEGDQVWTIRRLDTLEQVELPQLRFGMAALAGTVDAHQFALGPLLASGLAPAAIAAGIGAAVDNVGKLRILCRYGEDDLEHILDQVMPLPHLALIRDVVRQSARGLGVFGEAFRLPLGRT